MTQMTPPPTEPSKQPIGAGAPISKTLKFSKKRLALAFAIAGISDAIGAFARQLSDSDHLRISASRTPFEP
jgi:hypothetical protein